MVQGDGAEGVDAGDGPANDGRALRGRGVVGLEHKPAETVIEEGLSEGDVVNAAADEVGLDGHVEVIASLDRFHRDRRHVRLPVGLSVVPVHRPQW